MAADYSKPIQKYRAQARAAKYRGIEWQMTFDVWTAIWRDSGRWEQRGTRIGQYVMARKGDVGPYSEENVYICLASENHSHAHLNGRVPTSPARPKPPKRIPNGWCYREGRDHPYQVTCRKKYIGAFVTKAEADAAYAAALAQPSQRRVKATHPLISDSLVSHAAEFCADEPRNATQSFCGGTRA